MPIISKSQKSVELALSKILSESKRIKGFWDSFDKDSTDEENSISA
jgi:hypothetical protein